MKVKDLVWEDSTECKRALELWINPNNFTLHELKKEIKRLESLNNFNKKD